MPLLHVHPLPQFVEVHDLAGSTVVVIDLLRASTTLCYALAAGASGVVPHVEIEAVFAAAQELDRSKILLGGERQGVRVDQFDLGNSPTDYTPEVVFGMKILFTTTNGTRALHHARLAQRIVIGAMANLSAVTQSLLESPINDPTSNDPTTDDPATQQPDIHLLCAGTNGHVSRDDLLAAGAIAYQLLTTGPKLASNEGLAAVSWELNDSAERAVGEWEELLQTASALKRSPSEQLALELRDTPGGKNLIAIGQDDDLPLCAAIDSRPVVPEYHLATGTLRL